MLPGNSLAETFIRDNHASTFEVGNVNSNIRKYGLVLAYSK
ncbi:MAG: hypothetical protein ACKA33_01080 [Candidatus Karelsulcia muelleri]